MSAEEIKCGMTRIRAQQSSQPEVPAETNKWQEGDVKSNADDGGWMRNYRPSCPRF